MDFKEINVNELDGNVFTLIGKEWMLITAEDNNKINTMTASWGGLGVLWNKNVAFTFIRPQRYTKQFVDNSEYFSLTFFDKEYREKLSYLGTVSGKDEDKIHNTNLTVCHLDDVPAFEEARIVLICKKLYCDDIKESNFMYKETVEKTYPLRDFHTMYISEVVKAYVK